MREIKFRAWSTRTKKMFPEVASVDTDSTEHEKLKTINTSIKEAQQSGLILMQYTGLKDSNGKEIYEGDIIEFTTLGGNTMVYEVRWKNRGFNLKHMPQFSPNRMTEHNQSEIEVIGNIYENSDLLG